jgi:hypothetical protein
LLKRFSLHSRENPTSNTIRNDRTAINNSALKILNISVLVIACSPRGVSLKNILLRRSKAGFKKLFQLIPVLVMGLLFYLATLYCPDTLNFITSGIKHHSSSFLMFRWGVILTVAMLWSYFVHVMASVYKSPLEEEVYWKAQRFRIVVWLIIFELLICENIITEFVHLVVGS